jgi:hypothetical protein
VTLKASGRPSALFSTNANVAHVGELTNRRATMQPPILSLSDINTPIVCMSLARVLNVIDEFLRLSGFV